MAEGSATPKRQQVSDRADVLNALTGRLRRLSTRRTRITPSTLIYRDLGISGDEAVNLVLWIAEEFDVDFSTMESAYLPSRPRGFIEAVICWLGWSDCRDITVEQLIESITAGYWTYK